MTKFNGHDNANENELCNAMNWYDKIEVWHMPLSNCLKLGKTVFILLE